MNKSISDFEDQIAEAKNDFFVRFKNILSLVQNQSSLPLHIRNEITDLHNRGNCYFTLFERSITEYGLKYYQQDENIRNSKINDALDIAATIIKYWNVLKSLEKKYDIRIPKPSERSYSTLQAFIKEFEPDKVLSLSEKFQKCGLPIHGFTTQRKFKDMSKTNQVKFSVIAGTVFLVSLVIIALFIGCPTNFQDNTFKTVLALAAASYAAAIPGLIDINYRGVITASGAIAVFVVVFLFKPAEISDFKSCNKSISGNIFFGDSPLGNTTVEILTTNQTTQTDQFGKFDLPVDFTNLSNDVRIRIINNEIASDTIFNFQKNELKQKVNIAMIKHCVTCKRLKSDGSIDFRKFACSASHRYISNFIEGFSDKCQELGMTAECRRE